MKFSTHNDGPVETNMSSLQGYLQSTRARLTAVFGEPELVGDKEDKVQLEWSIKFEDGTVATLYDWKTHREMPIDELYSWHIGGYASPIVGRVHDAYRESSGLMARAA